MLMNFSVDRARISTQLSSSLNIQSQHAINFQNGTQLFDTLSSTAQGFAVDINCENISMIFEYADQSLIFKNNYFWTFYDEPNENCGEISVRKYRF